MQTLRRIFSTSLVKRSKANSYALARAAPFSASGSSQTVLPENASLELLSEQLKRDFDFYSEHTRDPIFRVLPKNDGGTPPEELLVAARVPEHEYASWSGRLRGGCFSDIARYIGHNGMHTLFTRRNSNHDT